MKQEIKTCDIEGVEHTGKVETMKIDVIWHDEEDDLTTYAPYLREVEIEICKSCKDFMFKNSRYINAYGSSGDFKYYLFLE